MTESDIYPWHFPDHLRDFQVVIKHIDNALSNNEIGCPTRRPDKSIDSGLGKEIQGLKAKVRSEILQR